LPGRISWKNPPPVVENVTAATPPGPFTASLNAIVPTGVPASKVLPPSREVNWITWSKLPAANP
jgi:hypothetical protein